MNKLIGIVFFCFIHHFIFSQIDTLEFQKGYPDLKSDALTQLKNYPSPRYVPNNNFLRLYNWMSPYYAGGAGQPGIKIPDGIKRGAEIQEELALNWNYNLVISNPRIAPNEKALADPNNALSSFINLANKHPEIPLSVTIFWTQIRPDLFGGDYYEPNIMRADYPESYYLKDARINKTKRVISYAAPDSVFIEDGLVQKKQLEILIKHLTRPINIINENGEEPPKAYKPSLLNEDKLLIADKKKSGISSWEKYIATKKKYIRHLYSSQFMEGIPQLKNTAFTIYQVEGGPIDRFDWGISKSSCSKINGNYYSTPDLYPRTPDNWKNRKGAWHGWKWINDGRKVEIADGDKFFSPFVAAGWATNPEEDMRPAQWLGLLKCLSVVGAEFYYTGYFNLKQPYSKPENYIWQAAMPAYAQAITTHYSSIFRNGNVLFDSDKKPIITYPVTEDDVLVTVRKHDSKEQYIIAATLQPNSNTERIPQNKNIEIKIDGESFLINVRRQGSVYLLDKTSKPYVFYQLDKWHQYEHPSRWRKELIYEAEVFDTSISPITIKTNYKTIYDKTDFTDAVSYISLLSKQWLGYNINSKDIQRFSNKIYIMIHLKCNDNIDGEIKINDWKKDFTSVKNENWNWMKTEVPKEVFMNGKSSLLKIIDSSGDLEIDKIIISDSWVTPDLKNY